MNVQFAVKDGDIYMLEVNPRASRTVPFVAKATGVPIAKIAARVMAGEKLRRLRPRTPATRPHIAVKEAVFPFARFPGVDIILGPEMKSTGEVMGLDRDFRPRLRQVAARRRHQPAADRHRLRLGQGPATSRRSSRSRRELIEMGFELLATGGTASHFREAAACRCERDQQGARGPPAHRRRDAATARSSWSSTPPRAPRRSPTASACAGPP